MLPFKPKFKCAHSKLQKSLLFFYAVVREYWGGADILNSCCCW